MIRDEYRWDYEWERYVDNLDENRRLKGKWYEEFYQGEIDQSNRLIRWNILQ